MPSPKFLLVSNVDAPYVRNDLHILGELGVARFLKYGGREDLGRLGLAVAGSDVVLCWFVIGYATTSVLLGRAIGTRSMVIAGGWDVAAIPELGYGALLRSSRIPKTRLALRFADAVLAVSEATRGQVLRWTRRDVRVVPNGVDVDRFRPADIHRQDQVITVVGIDNEVRYRVKGVDMLLEVASRMPDVPFVLVGRNAPEWDRRLRALAPPNLSIRSHVPHENLIRLYQESRVCAQLSAYESFCVSVAESMACGCVPVVTNRGALPEVVGDTGPIVRFGDIDAAVAAIRSALTMSGLPARRRVVERFSLAHRRELLKEMVREFI